jgi:hypothetical protein
MKQYIIKPVTTGFFSGSLSETKLQDFLNQHGAKGWKFIKSIHETKKVLGIFSREAHFVIFERDDSPPALPDNGTSDTNLLLQQLIERIDNDPTPHLLRQLLRSYQIEPEA